MTHRTATAILVETDLPDPHPERARQLLREHPEIRGLFGRNRTTCGWVIAVVTLQYSLALLAHGRPWYVIVLLAWLVGAFANHALWALVHECMHHLVFSRPWANRLLAIVANLPMGLPAAIPFGMYHLTHHKYLGVPEYDADLPAPYERWLLNRGWIGRLTWQVLYPVIQSLRTLWVEPAAAPRSLRRWLIPNIAAVLIADIAVLSFLGIDSLGYLILSSLFGVGPHLLGARWIQEHYTNGQEQETSSYYGWLNRLQFNIGLHTEHHDFPQVPWNRLPLVRSAAPELYQGLNSHQSWGRLWLRFLFDRHLSLARVVRKSSAEIKRSAAE